MRLSSMHQTCRERAGLDERCRLRRAEPARDRHAVSQPRPPACTARGIVLGGVTAVGRETPITPRIAEFGGKFGMEFEAPPCQSIKRAATAPVEGQEATRLAGGRTGDGMTFYDSRPRAASACEVGDCGTDCATTANHDARARTHSSYLCQSWLPSSRAALVEGGRIRPRCRVRGRRGDPNFPLRASARSTGAAR